MKTANRRTLLISAIVAVAVLGVGATAIAMIAGSAPESPTTTPSATAPPTPEVTPEPEALLPRVSTARADIDAWSLAARTDIAAVLPEVGDAADGAVALRVDAPTGEEGMVAASVPVELAPSTTYEVTASVRLLATHLTDTGVQLRVGGATFALPELFADWEQVAFTVTTPADQGAGSFDIVLGGPVRGFGIDNVQVTEAGQDSVVPNGSFEQVQTPRGLVNDSLILTTSTATLAVSMADGPTTWTLTSSSGGDPITGTVSTSGPLAAVPLTDAPQGHYALTVSDAAGLQISTNVAIVDSPSFFIAQDARFGVGAHVEKDPFAGSGTLAASLGFAEVRNDITWSRNERTRGVYDWDSNYVREFSRLHANGVKLLGIIAYGNELYGNKRVPSGAEAIQAYGAYARAVADRFDMVGLEVLNEYNHRDNGTSCGHDPVCYVPIVQSVRDHVKDAYPDLPIVTGSTALYDHEWFLQFWAAGGMPVTDVISYHPYEATIQRKPDLISSIVTQSVADMSDATGETRPVWITELGFSTMQGGVGVSEIEQGEMLVRTQTLALSNGAEKYFWYDLVNDQVDPGEVEANFGLYENGPRANVVALAPKPAAFAQALLIAQLGGRTGATESRDDTTTAVTFGNADDAVVVAWAPPGAGERSVTSGTPVTVTDMAGASTTIDPVGTDVSIPLTDSPVIITGITPPAPEATPSPSGTP